MAGKCQISTFYVAYLGQYVSDTRELLYTHSLGYNERFKKQNYIESAPLAPPKMGPKFLCMLLGLRQADYQKLLIYAKIGYIFDL